MKEILEMRDKGLITTVTTQLINPHHL